jgi:hypothetical protein
VDPNTALTDIRDLIAHTYTADGPAAEDSCRRLYELVEALDGWLSKGGFLPDAWRTASSAKGDLSPNDHILTRAGRDLDGPGLPYSMCLSLHLYPDTPIFVRVHKAEHRAIVQFGHVRAETILFADAAQVQRLATLFAHVSERLPT